MAKEKKVENKFVSFQTFVNEIGEITRKTVINKKTGEVKEA